MAKKSEKISKKDEKLSKEARKILNFVEKKYSKAPLKAVGYISSKDPDDFNIYDNNKISREFRKYVGGISEDLLEYLDSRHWYVAGSQKYNQTKCKSKQIVREIIKDTLYGEKWIERVRLNR